jgi:hypothetical protein
MSMQRPALLQGRGRARGGGRATCADPLRHAPAGAASGEACPSPQRRAGTLPFPFHFPYPSPPAFLPRVVGITCHATRM